MSIGINVVLNIRDNSTGVYYRMPVLPPSIAYKEGDALADSVKVLNMGNVDFLNGVDLDSMDWSSFFPARYDPGYCQFSNIKTPHEYRNLFQKWKNNGTSLQLICSAAGINQQMTLRTFNWELKGFEGDIYYSVTFKQKKNIRPRKVAVSVSGDGTISKKTPPEARPPAPPAPAAPAPKTYTVKSGDCLCTIAKKLGISSWETLYENNKGVIGGNPNLIYPGQVLTI